MIFTSDQVMWYVSDEELTPDNSYSEMSRWPFHKVMEEEIEAFRQKPDYKSKFTSKDVKAYLANVRVIENMAKENDRLGRVSKNYPDWTLDGEMCEHITHFMKELNFYHMMSNGYYNHAGVHPFKEPESGWLEPMDIIRKKEYFDRLVACSKGADFYEKYPTKEEWDELNYLIDTELNDKQRAMVPGYGCRYKQKPQPTPQELKELERKRKLEIFNETGVPDYLQDRDYDHVIDY